MLIEKETRETPLSVVREPVKIIRMKPPAKIPAKRNKKDKQLSPPVNKFNTRYLKGRDNDPL